MVNKQNISYFLILFLIGVVIFLSGCSANKANRQLSRAKKLIAKAELNGATWSSDTVMVRVPVILTETRVDSLFVPKPGDTVVISKDRLKIVYIDLPGDSVFLEGECAADTVYREVPVTVTKVVSAAKSW